MTSPALTTDRDLIAAQTGRAPRDPWRVAARCSFGRPAVIVSPSVLADGERFPTWAWLTCPHLSDAAAASESAGGARAWAERAAQDPELASALEALDTVVRARRAGESSVVDACSATGLAGQRDPLGVKCLHAHVAYALAGLSDPIGAELVAMVGAECANDRCAALPEPAARPAVAREGARRGR